MNEDLIVRRIRPPTPAAPPTPARPPAAAMPPAGWPPVHGSPPPFDRPTPLAAPAEDDYFLEPSDEFVSNAPPWDTPPDYEEWASDMRQPGAQAAPVEAQALEPEEAAFLDRPVDEIDRGLAGLELWSVPSALERDAPFADDGAGADEGGDTVAGAGAHDDPDDSLAPLASDLLISQPEPTVDTRQWPERDLLAAAVVAHEPGVEQPLLPADQPEQAAGQAVASPQPITDRRRSAPSPIRYSSVFGDLFGRPPGALPHRHPLAAADSEAEAAIETTAGMAVEDPLEWPPVPTGLFQLRPELNVETLTEGDLRIRWPDQPQAQIFWPDVAPPEPVSLPVPEPEPELSPPVEAEAWPELPAWPEPPAWIEPHALPEPGSVAGHQPSSAPTFDDPAGQPSPAPDASPDPQSELPATFDRSTDRERAAWSLFVTADPRFDPDPLGRDLSSEPLRLIFSDPPPQPPTEPEPVASSDGPIGRLTNQATALAERVPDNWGLARVPSVGTARDDTLVHDLRDIPSPALTVVFAVTVIAAVLLFVYLVTPLLR